MTVHLHSGLSAPSRQVQKRVEARARVAIEARLETIHGRASGYLLNLSCHGAMVQTPEPPPPGHDVLLRCGPLEALGCVMWVQHERIGMEFYEELSEEFVVDLRRLADEAVRHRAH